MKLSIRVLFAVLSLFAFSCNDDDESSPRASEVTIDGESIKLTQAYQSYYSSGESTTFYLYFTGTGVELEEYENYDGFSGTGKLIYIYITVPGVHTTLPAGSYAFNYSEYYDLIDGDWDYLDELDSEENIVITKSGNNYTLTFKASGFEGETPATYDFHYTGTVLNARLAS